LLMTWIVESTRAERARRRFEERAIAWERNGRRGGFLDAVELLDYSGWLASNTPADLGTTALLEELVEQSRIRQRRGRPIRRVAVLTLTLAAIAVSILAVVAINQSHRARSNADIAQHRASEALIAQREAQSQLADNYLEQGRSLLQANRGAASASYLVAA